MYQTAEEARNCPKGQMRLVEDLQTGLVRNAAFDPALMNYDAAYQNEQGNSAHFRAHMEDVASLVSGKMGSENLVEVGCGKGAFLDIMLERGADVTGFDPAYEGDSDRIRKVYFSEDLGIRAQGMILRHVLEHIDDPFHFLQRLSDANGNRGLIYIEVPCFDWICENRAWYDIFYEHVNYFRLSDFRRIFGRVVHADRAFGGQYLRVIGDLATLQAPSHSAGSAPGFPSDFTRQLDALDMPATDASLVVWGGASKGVIFSLLSERAGCKVTRLIDINPAKQGLFVPGTGLQVSSPEEGLTDLLEGTTIWVMNPNYLDEIRAMSGPSFKYRTLSND
ncbi:MAG: methyltransferase domain-containing protein [Roseibium sp.]|nr:methyltransferase domain-containing protein [Roseibium sp.]